MSELNPVVIYIEYGKINVKLKEYFDPRGITRNHICQATNTRFEVINKWYNNEVERMDLDILARICYVLDCKPEDIISYEKPEKK